MVTAGTYQKEPYFRSSRRLEWLCDALLNAAQKHGWELQAWAVFPNHYHFIAISPPSANILRRMIQELHSLSAREVNRWDETPARRIWFEYWDTSLTYARAYLARLSYVHNNAVHHGLVRVARDYPWCSAGWFERKADRSFYKTVASFTGKGIKVRDDFDVSKDHL